MSEGSTVARQLVTSQVCTFIIVNEQIPKDITEKVKLNESQVFNAVQRLKTNYSLEKMSKLIIVDSCVP